MKMFFWYRWRGALPPDLSSVVWRTVRLASLHCRYIAATNLPPFAKRLARHQSGGCLFALRSPQASDGPRTTYLTRSPLPHPLHSHPQVVFLSFISVSVCLLHAPCGCARVYARVRREKKKDNSWRQDDKDVRCLRASYSFCTESDANFTRLAVEDCFKRAKNEMRWKKMNLFALNKAQFKNVLLAEKLYKK